VTRDIKPTLAGIWRAVEEFGSIYHLAIAIGVSPEDLQSWLSGTAEMPLEKYELMLALVASQKATRH